MRGPQKGDVGQVANLIEDYYSAQGDANSERLLPTLWSSTSLTDIVVLSLSPGSGDPESVWLCTKAPPVILHPC